MDIKRIGGHVLAVAAAFAVALAVLVSSPTAAEAATVTLGSGEESATAAPGDTVNIVVGGAFANVSITGTASGVSASFVSGGGQSIQCSDDGSCDIDDDGSGGNVSGSVTVALKVANDSGAGHILLSVAGLGATTTTKVITVSKAGQLGSLALKASATTIAASGGTSTITATAKNAASTPAGLDDQRVTFITTLGSLNCPATQNDAGTTIAAAPNTQACDMFTGDDGTAIATLSGAGVEGAATITARTGSLTKQVTVTMFGTAKNLTAEPRQNSIEIGGSVFVVLTVTDGAGHPVSGQVISPLAAGKEVTGPSKDAVTVVTSKDTTTDTADGTGYNVDYIDANNAKNNIPACGDDKDPVTNADATPPTTEDFATNGTNAKGQCVVHVTATKASGDVKAATRGVHTLNFQVKASVKASAMIEVAGSPASITTDAPSMVDPASVTAIEVSVWDDTEVLVGITTVKIRKVDGGGLIEDAGTATKNGKAKFTYIAPRAAGTAEILITAGKVNHRLELTIGDPTPPTPPVSVSAQSGLVVIQNAGSIGDILGALACGDDAGTTVTLPGNNIYVVGAPAVVNSAFMSNVQFPIDIAPAYVSCG